MMILLYIVAGVVLAWLGARLALRILGARVRLVVHDPYRKIVALRPPLRSIRVNIHQICFGPRDRIVEVILRDGTTVEVWPCILNFGVRHDRSVLWIMGTTYPESDRIVLNATKEEIDARRAPGF